MKGPDVTLTNGRYEFRSSLRGSILYLADPPEAGWRMQRSAVRPVHEPKSSDPRDRSAQ
jgi:hypothetical protein